MYIHDNNSSIEQKSTNHNMNQGIHQGIHASTHYCCYYCSAIVYSVPLSLEYKYRILLGLAKRAPRAKRANRACAVRGCELPITQHSNLTEH